MPPDIFRRLSTKSTSSTRPTSTSVSAHPSCPSALPHPADPLKLTDLPLSISQELAIRAGIRLADARNRPKVYEAPPSPSMTTVTGVLAVPSTPLGLSEIYSAPVEAGGVHAEAPAGAGVPSRPKPPPHLPQMSGPQPGNAESPLDPARRETPVSENVSTPVLLPLRAARARPYLSPLITGANESVSPTSKGLINIRGPSETSQLGHPPRRTSGRITSDQPQVASALRNGINVPQNPSPPLPRLLIHDPLIDQYREMSFPIPDSRPLCAPPSSRLSLESAKKLREKSRVITARSPPLSTVGNGGAALGQGNEAKPIGALREYPPNLGVFPVSSLQRQLQQYDITCNDYSSARLEARDDGSAYHMDGRISPTTRPPGGPPPPFGISRSRIRPVTKPRPFTAPDRTICIGPVPPPRPVKSPLRSVESSDRSSAGPIAATSPLVPTFGHGSAHRPIPPHLVRPAVSTTAGNVPSNNSVSNLLHPGRQHKGPLDEVVGLDTLFLKDSQEMLSQLSAFGNGSPQEMIEGLPRSCSGLPAFVPVALNAQSISLSDQLSSQGEDERSTADRWTSRIADESGVDHEVGGSRLNGLGLSCPSSRMGESELRPTSSTSLVQIRHLHNLIHPDWASMTNDGESMASLDSGPTARASPLSPVRRPSTITDRVFLNPTSPAIPPAHNAHAQPALTATEAEYANVRAWLCTLRVEMQLLDIAKGRLYSSNAFLMSTMDKIKLAIDAGRSEAVYGGKTAPIEPLLSLQTTLDEWWREESARLNAMRDASVRKYAEYIRVHDGLVAKARRASKRQEEEGVGRSTISAFTEGMRVIIKREAQLQKRLDEPALQRRIKRWAIRQVQLPPVYMLHTGSKPEREQRNSEVKDICEQAVKRIMSLESDGSLGRGTAMAVWRVMRDVGWAVDGLDMMIIAHTQRYGVADAEGAGSESSLESCELAEQRYHQQHTDPDTPITPKTGKTRVWDKLKKAARRPISRKSLQSADPNLDASDDLTSMATPRPASRMSIDRLTSTFRPASRALGVIGRPSGLGRLLSVAAQSSLDLFSFSNGQQAGAAEDTKGRTGWADMGGVDGDATPMPNRAAGGGRRRKGRRTSLGGLSMFGALMRGGDDRVETLAGPDRGEDETPRYNPRYDIRQHGPGGGITARPLVDTINADPRTIRQAPNTLYTTGYPVTHLESSSIKDPHGITPPSERSIQRYTSSEASPETPPLELREHGYSALFKDVGRSSPCPPRLPPTAQLAPNGSRNESDKEASKQGSSLHGYSDVFGFFNKGHARTSVKDERLAVPTFGVSGEAAGRAIEMGRPKIARPSTAPTAHKRLGLPSEWHSRAAARPGLTRAGLSEDNNPRGDIMDGDGLQRVSTAGRVEAWDLPENQPSTYRSHMIRTSPLFVE